MPCVNQSNPFGISEGGKKKLTGIKKGDDLSTGCILHDLMDDVENLVSGLQRKSSRTARRGTGRNMVPIYPHS